MGLLTAPIMSNFPKCCTFVHPLYGWLNHPWFFYHRMGNVHGRLHYRPYMCNSLGRPYYRPRETLLIINHILIQITFLSLLGWFLIQSALQNIDDPYGRIGDELISRHPISCPFVQRVVQDIDVI